MAAPPVGRSFTVTASTFGGPNDPGTGSTGYRGDNLNVKQDSFAELSNNPQAGTGADFSALGGLPYGTPITVTNPQNGRSIVVYKRDVGAGGAGLNGTKRAVDLWHTQAQKLGLNGLGVVKVTIGKTAAGGNAAPLPNPSAATRSSAPASPTSSFDQRGFDKANKQFILGQFLRSQGSSPWDVKGMPKATGFGGGGMLAGLLPTTAPNPQDFQTLQAAHNSLQQLTGTPLKLHPGLQATVPGASGKIQSAVSLANTITQHHYNYEWGGGHGQIGVPGHGTGHGSGPGTGYDCSGAVSAILHSVGALNQPLVASQFMSYGQPGPGHGPNDITIYASPTHVFMQMGGKFFGTSAQNPGGGADWFNHAQTAGFTVRHVTV